MRRVLAAAVLALTAGACSGPSDDATLPAAPTVPVATSEATTTSAPPAPATTTGDVAPEPCRSAALQLAQVDGRAALGHGLGIFELRSTSGGPCRLSGHPGVRLLDASGGVLAEGRREGGALIGTRAPAPVTIGAGGAAYFGIEWRNVCAGGDPVDESDRVEVAPPGETAAVVVAAAIPVCADPSIVVSPVRASADAVAGR